MTGYRKHCNPEPRTPSVQPSPKIPSPRVPIRELVNPNFGTEAKRVLGHVGPLLRFSDALIEAKKAVAEGKGSKPLIEEDLRSQAAEMRERAADLGATTLRVVNHLEATGALGPAWHALLEHLRKKKVKDANSSEILRGVLDMPSIQKILDENGVDRKALAKATSALDALHHTISYADGLKVASMKHPIPITVVAPGTTRHSQTLTGRLLSPTLLDVAASIDHLGKAGIDLIPNPAGHEHAAVDPLESLAVGMVAGIKDLDLRLERLEEVGIDALEGGAWVFVVLIVIAVVGAAAVAAGAIITILCSTGDITDSTTCDAGLILLLLGIVLLAGAVDCLVEGCKLVFTLSIEGIPIFSSEFTYVP